MMLSTAKPVWIRRCPATVMPPAGGWARAPGQRRRPVLGGRAARSDPSGESQRTHFVLHGKPEDEW